MSILQMRYYLVLAKHQNLAKAANELQLSTTALSKNLSRLEADLGVRLFERSNKGLQLNEAGIVTQEAFTKVLKILDNMNDELSDISNCDQQKLSILAVSNLSVAAIISGFKQNNPNCSLDFSEQSFQNVEKIDAIFKHDFLIAGPDYTSNEKLNAEIIGEYYPILMVPEGHALTKLKECTLSDIAAYPLVSSQTNTPWRNYIDGLFQNEGLSPVTVASASYLMRSQMVASGLGISIASTTPGSIPQPRQGLVLLPIKGTFSPWHLYLYWNKSRYSTKIMKKFKEYAITQYRLTKQKQIAVM